jgi:V/A-type H+-transporting ATPase subunit A
MPVAARESSVYMGITIAEYYRQMGFDVLVLADSTSRWAQALREMSGRLEEIPGEEAFPAYLASRIAEFYERSGVISLRQGKPGSITIGGAVSPAGGNFEEPVTQATLSVVGAFLGLSRARSDSRRYPAIDPLISWSKYVDTVSKELEHQVEGWGKMVKRANRILHQGSEIGKRMEVVGEEGIAMEDMIVYLKSELYDFCYLQQNAFDKEEFGQFYKEFFAAMRSLRVNNDLFDMISSTKKRAELKALTQQIKNEWQGLLLKQQQDNPEASLDVLKENLFTSEHFQNQFWNPFKAMIKQKFSDMAIEWQNLFINTTEDELFTMTLKARK